MVNINNRDDVWEITMQLYNKELENSGFLDAAYSVSRQLFFYTCPNLITGTNPDNSFAINQYHYCKEMNTPAYEGSFHKQPAKWLERWYIIRGALAKLESIQIKKAKKGN